MRKIKTFIFISMLFIACLSFFSQTLPKIPRQKTALGIVKGTVLDVQEYIKVTIKLYDYRKGKIVASNEVSPGTGREDFSFFVPFGQYKLRYFYQKKCNTPESPRWTSQIDARFDNKTGFYVFLKRDSKIFKDKSRSFKNFHSGFFITDLRLNKSTFVYGDVIHLTSKVVVYGPVGYKSIQETGIYRVRVSVGGAISTVKEEEIALGPGEEKTFHVSILPAFCARGRNLISFGIGGRTFSIVKRIECTVE